VVTLAASAVSAAPSTSRSGQSAAPRVVVKLATAVGDPVALAFNPRDGALWIVADRVGTLADTTTVVTGLGTTGQRVRTYTESGRHYLANPRAIAFSLGRNEFGTASAKGGGPTVWRADLDTFRGTRRSYLDMAHHSEPALGITAGADTERREYWVVNGRERSVDRYFFNEPRDHRGVVFRYARGSLRPLSAFQAGIALDRSTGSVYVSDAQNGRIVRLDPESVAAPRFEDAPRSGVVSTIPAAPTALVQGLRRPGALVFARQNLFVAEIATGTIHVYSRNGERVARLPTGIRPGDLAGIAVAENGSLYALDSRRRFVIEVGP
jgi:hypothetical protein